MALEPGVTYIEDLVATNPVAGDDVEEGQNHLNIIKTGIQGSFPSLGAVAVTKTAAEINDLVEQTDPVLNGTVTGTGLETTLTNDDTKLPTSGAVFDKVAGLNTKVVDIGDWDMDATAAPTVAHGLTFSKIRTVKVMVRNDADTILIDLKGFDGSTTTPAGYYYVLGASIQLGRVAGKGFDNTSYNSTSYNRGWITIQYTD